jgi:hypothetical protein
MNEMLRGADGFGDKDVAKMTRWRVVRVFEGFENSLALPLCVMSIGTL